MTAANRCTMQAVFMYTDVHQLSTLTTIIEIHYVLIYLPCVTAVYIRQHSTHT